MLKKYKKIILILFLTIIPLQAFEFDLVAPFNGSISPGGHAYYPVISDLQFLIGATATIAAKQSEKSNMNLQLGVNTPALFLGPTDFYLTIINEGNKQTYVHSLSIRKHFFYSLNPSIKLGVSVVLTEILLHRAYKAHILKEIYPSIGISVTF